MSVGTPSNALTSSYPPNYLPTIQPILLLLLPPPPLSLLFLHLPLLQNGNHNDNHNHHRYNNTRTYSHSPHPNPSQPQPDPLRQRGIQSGVRTRRLPAMQNYWDHTVQESLHICANGTGQPHRVELRSGVLQPLVRSDSQLRHAQHGGAGGG